jgi:hypothetical protein
VVGRRGIGLLVGATVLLAACGGTSRTDFDEEIDERGGGLGADLPVEAIEALEEELGGEIALRSMTINRGVVQVEVLVPGTTDQLDNYRYGSSGLYGIKGLSDPTPVTGVGSAEELRSTLFRPERIALDDLDAVVDDALDEADIDGGYVQTVHISRSGRRPTITVSVNSERENAMIQFTGDGQLAEAPG